MPVHIIGPEDLVSRFAEIGWTEGMLPAPDLPALRIDRLRDLLLDRLSTGAP